MAQVLVRFHDRLVELLVPDRGAFPPNDQGSGDITAPFDPVALDADTAAGVTVYWHNDITGVNLRPEDFGVADALLDQVVTLPPGWGWSHRGIPVNQSIPVAVPGLPPMSTDVALDLEAFAAVPADEQTVYRALVLVRRLLPAGWIARVTDEIGSVEVYEGDIDDDNNWRFAIAPHGADGRWDCFFVDDDGEDSSHDTVEEAAAAGLANYGAAPCTGTP